MFSDMKYPHFEFHEQRSETPLWRFVLGVSIIGVVFFVAVFFAIIASSTVIRAAAVSIIILLSFFYARMTRHHVFALKRSLATVARDHTEAVELAERDPLTRLPNRIAFNQILNRCACEPGQDRITILFFDLNRFKDVNDTLGHTVGDRLLCAVALRLQPLFDEAKILARIGGDEFAAILPGDRPSKAQEYGQKIREILNQPFIIDGHEILVGTSVGAATGSAIVEGGEELLRRADLAMYEAKSMSSGDLRLFDSRLNQKLSERRGIRLEMPTALVSGQITVAFQPIVDARNGRMISAEALMRWMSPVLGQVSPALAVPVAEESGQIVALTDLTLKQSLDVARQISGGRIGVNISPVAFRQSGFVDAVANHLIAAGLGPESLYLEITEGVLISHMEQARTTIGQLRTLGIEIYLDDFGTGYSSLGYLQNFELDGMKIDKSFLRNIGQRDQATQIMRSVVNLGHSLDMVVVAEGVENDWQARLLQLLSCDRLQGYHYAAPMVRDQFLSYARDDASKAALIVLDSIDREQDIARRA